MPRPPNPLLPEMLLNAALEMLDERQDATFSMRELSSRIGYAVTAIYRCYETRGHLLRQLTLRLFAQLDEALSGIDEGSATADLIELGRRFTQFAMDHPGRYRLMFEHNDTEALLIDSERQVLDMVVLRIEALLHLGIERGEFGISGDVPARAALVFSAWHGLIALSNTNRFRHDGCTAAFYSEHAPVALAGLLAA